MRKIIAFSFLLVLGIVMLSLSLGSVDVVYAGDGCYMCGSGSKDNIKQCRYHGSDTYAQRKKCKSAGCNITGTTSCSSAANVKVIDPN